MNYKDDLFAALDTMFYPKNVVILRASEKLWYFIEGFKRQNFDLDKLYLVNNSEEELFGIKTYNSWKEIPDKEIDHLIIAIKKERLIQNLKEILDGMTIKTIHFFTAGLGESDKKGTEIEKQIKEILKNANYSPRAIGPNCMGVYNPKGHISYYASFPTEPGNIALIFQSGDLHSKMVKIGSRRHSLRFSKGVTVGNCIDLQVSDFLIYFNEDNDTDLVCVYFEGFSKFHESEGRNLFDALKNMRKPVLFMRGGISKRAQSAVLTHTGSLASNEKIWKGIFRQTTAVQVAPSLDDIIDITYIFYSYINRYKKMKKPIKYPNGKQVLVILWSGGFGILATDTLAELGLELPHFKGEMLEKLKAIYPLKIGSLSNPLDLPWIVHTKQFRELSKKAISGEIDLVIIETDAWSDIESERFKNYYSNLLEIKKYTEDLDKILIIVLPLYESKKRQKFKEMLANDDFIIFPSIRRAGKAFLALHNYGIKSKSIK
ncbi:MAG: hypothetical protein EU539_02570 [Promethearchaeota archaeon]|nr:MAG: hypothetical protein EU539_02570 [Candidatus Lokiarchaeota archaeon]